MTDYSKSGEKNLMGDPPCDWLLTLLQVEN